MDGLKTMSNLTIIYFPKHYIYSEGHGHPCLMVVVHKFQTLQYYYIDLFFQE